MISVDRQAFMGALATIQRIAPPKPTVPVLSRVHVEASRGMLALTCTDLYTYVRTTIAGDGDLAPLTADVRQTLDRAKRFANGRATLATLGADKLVLAEGGSRRFELEAWSGEDFPPSPPMAQASALCVTRTDALALAIDRTAYAISDDEARPHLNSLLFEFSAETLRTVATDGHRLALHDEPIGTGVRSPKKGPRPTLPLLVAKDAVAHLRHLLGGKSSKGPSSPVSLSTDGVYLYASVRGYEYAARLVAATFPPYEQVIPEGAARSVTADAKALLAALKAVNLNKRTGGVVLRTGDDVRRLTLESVYRAEDGQGADEVEAHRMGPPGEVCVNANYLIDAIEGLGSERVTLDSSGALDPIVVRPLGGKVAVLRPLGGPGPDLAIVMPMRH